MPERKLSKVYVKDISDLIVKDPSTISPEASLDDLLAKVIENPVTRHVYVIDDNKVLIGSVRLNNIIEYLFPFTTIAAQKYRTLVSLDPFVRIEPKVIRDIMNGAPAFVFENTPLSEMVSIMMREKINELPVVNRKRQIIGEVNTLEIIDYYLKNK